ncbi:MAG TPA: serine protein kinase RIO [Nitrososphaeria archaeon]|uniref:non-specific serine/threonine protein kinase n=1 Tax=Conexivisphaera calida TaxID=1874277 RepID=A0A4P2VBW9_9ARCH|nr:serine protein kinase RIO [Conexivisphaera calida]MDP7982457.1 serine protein kinase RIO [Conexivisphaerales archaeon]BBE41617.1 Serine/threonine-protein kinase RIO1 [Conexivisphaera calida]HEU16770.1 serine protein kinase RIO [Nitrososphaeria archaeon]
MSEDEEDRASERASREFLKRERRDRIKVKDADDYKVIEGVFDSRTLMFVYSLMKGGYIGSIKGAVKSGKEARVYWGSTPSGAPVAVKIYYTVASQFKRRLMYIEGDPRFTSIRRDPHGLAEVWARKEYANLKQAHDAGVKVPAPIAVRGNVLVMEFVGEGGRPAPLLAESEVDERDYNILIEDIGKLWRDASIVHADLSEYNVFKWRGDVILFDFGSSVDVSHPMAEEFLRRDVEIITKFFERHGISVRDPEEVVEEVLG